MKSRRWILILFAIVIVLCLATIPYLAKRLPPPQVSLEFQSFETNRTEVVLSDWTNSNEEVYFEGHGFTAIPNFLASSKSQANVLCIICLTNRGSTRIWWNADINWKVEARTPSGWVTNKPYYFSSMPYSVAPSSSDNFEVCVPTDATEWRVTGWYEYYNRHNARWEFIGWLLDDSGLGKPGTKRPPKITVYPLEAVAWVLSLLPEPREIDDQVYSEFFTNLLPTHLPPVKPSQR